MCKLSHPPEGPRTVDGAALPCARVGVRAGDISSPRVMAVVVTRDARPGWIDSLTRSLAAQRYRNLSVVVVDADSAEDVAASVHVELPRARVLHLSENPGYGAAANRVCLDSPPDALPRRVNGRRSAAGGGPEFFLLCHDDVVLEPRTIGALVTTARRWEADVVGPKLVDWDDPRRLAQFGVAVDRVGTTMPVVERGELDQGQYDGVQEVLAVPGGCTLVRASTFAAIGGFDEAISFLDDDVSLCWRARIAGARVVVTSSTRVRHREALDQRRTLAARMPDNADAQAVGDATGAAGPSNVGAEAEQKGPPRAPLTRRRRGQSREAPGARPANDVTHRRARSTWRRRLEARHRLRVLLTCHDWAHLLRVLPAALLVSLLTASGSLVRLRPREAWAEVAAWPWNLARVRSLHRLRRALAGVRRTPDRDIRQLQVKGLLAPRMVLRRIGSDHQAGPVVAHAPLRVSGAGGGGPSGRTAAVGIGLAIAVVLVFGSRHVLSRSLPAVGEFAPFGDSAHALLGEWALGWRRSGLGSDSAAPTGLGVFGALGWILGGHLALLRTAVTLGLVPLGIVGAYRALSPGGSRAAQLAAAVAYAAVPVPYNAVAAGRWSALAAYAAAPWIVGRLARAEAAAPFRADSARVAPGGHGASRAESRRRRLLHPIVAVGVVTGATGVVLPTAPLLLLVIAAALIAGAVLAFEVRGVLRLMATAIGGALVASVLLLPSTMDLVNAPDHIEQWLGFDRPTGRLSLSEVLRFDTGAVGGAPLGWALLVAAAAPLLVGRGWRLGWGIRGWVLAAGCWSVVWAQQEGWLDLALPHPDVLLAPAGLGLALAAAAAFAAFEHDVRGRSRRLGFRRQVVAAGTLALLAATVPVGAASLDGRWRGPENDFDELLSFVHETVAAWPSRVLWIGDPDVLPVGAWQLDRGLAYATTLEGGPRVVDLWPPADPGETERIADALDLAVGQQTARLGRLLAPMGVQYLAVPLRAAPAPFEGHDRTASPELLDGLGDQLDLAEIRVDPAIVLYRNTAFAAVRAAVTDPSVLEATTAADLQRVDISRAPPVLMESDGYGRYRGALDPGTTVLHSVAADRGWNLRDGDNPAPRRSAFGWATAYTVGSGGEAELGFQTPVRYWLLLATQAGLWLLATVVLLRTRPLRRAPVLRTVMAASSGGGGDGVRGEATEPSDPTPSDATPPDPAMPTATPDPAVPVAAVPGPSEPSPAGCPGEADTDQRPTTSPAV